MYFWKEIEVYSNIKIGILIQYWSRVKFSLITDYTFFIVEDVHAQPVSVLCVLCVAVRCNFYILHKSVLWPLILSPAVTLKRKVSPCRLSSQLRGAAVGAADRRGSLPGDRRAGGRLRCRHEQAHASHPVHVPRAFRSAAGRWAAWPPPHGAIVVPEDAESMLPRPDDAFRKRVFLKCCDFTQPFEVTAVFILHLVAEINAISSNVWAPSAVVVYLWLLVLSCSPWRDFSFSLCK